jgi:hypothetical protein
VVGSDRLSSEWRPHLTICRDGSTGQLASVRERLERSLPVGCEVDGLHLARLVEPGHAVTERL